MKYRRPAIALVMLASLVASACTNSGNGDGPLDPPGDSLPPTDPLPARTVFPPDNAWNRDISSEPVDPNSANLIASCGATLNLHPDFGTEYDGVPWGIPFG
jgi:hypothetical protein